jgi:leader peptidase (prepilin peptidase) / N-methyltransferase
MAAAAIAFLLGLIIGSFLNVVAWRLPRGESLLHPPSRCPNCGRPIKPYDNIPVLSWLLLRGHCRHCGHPISPRYPLVELTTGLLYAAVVLAKDDAVEIALGLLLVTAVVPIVLIDLEHRLIPNKITLPAAIAGVIAILVFDPEYIVEALIAGAAAGGFFFLAAVLYPRGMGMGDVKLAGLLGLYLGRAVGPALFAALILGVLVGGIIIARVGAAAGRKTAVPFGPFLAIGGLFGFFFGEDLANDYLDRF